MSDADLAAICRAYRHGSRRIRHCANPGCPGLTEPISRGDDVGLLPEELPDLQEAPDVTDELQAVPE